MEMPQRSSARSTRWEWMSGRLNWKKDARQRTMVAVLDFGGGVKHKVDLSMTLYADDIAKTHV
eukprot:10958586-Heterocapsa_arctica.AAC.1